MSTKNLGLFQNANLQLGNNLEATSKDYESDLSDIVMILNAFESIGDKIINDDVKTIFNEFCYDLFISVHLAINGIYRNSNASLRSACELALGFFYFKDYNYHFEKWKMKSFDLTWTLLVDEENGILSTKYLNRNGNFSKSADLIEDYKNIYRECSEYVHGKYSYMQTLKSTKIIYNKELFNDFYLLFKRLTTCIFSVYAIRFEQELSTITEDNLEFINEKLKKYSLNNFRIK